MSTTANSFGSSGRYTFTATAPALATGVRVRLDPAVTTTTFTNLQLIEGSAAIDWLPGEGMPRVALSGFERGYRAGWRRDIGVELFEVA